MAGHRATLVGKAPHCAVVDVESEAVLVKAVRDAADQGFAVPHPLSAFVYQVVVMNARFVRRETGPEKNLVTVIGRLHR